MPRSKQNQPHSAHEKKNSLSAVYPEARKILHDYWVLKETCDDPLKNDFVKTCQQYLDEFDIKLSFKEIENMYQWTFKKLVKEKTAGLKYLPTYKNRIKPQIFIIMIYRCKNILLMETARKTFLS